ncbi:MAG: glycine betaine ABC transporter substrate-binding protein [Acidimicrobiales bacterium]
MRPVSTRRPNRLAAIGLTALTVTAVACSSSGSSSSSANSSSTGGTAGTGTPIASKLVLGGPPECPQNAFCIPGLQKTYGITFKDFKPLDSDGPLTYQALTTGSVDVAEVFSSDAQIVADNLVVLTDDKHLQSADYIVPVVRNDKATPGVVAVLDKVSAALTTDELIGLNKKVTIDKADPQPTADAWLKSKGLDTASTGAAGVTIKIAGFNFSESSIVAYAYGDALKAAGANVTVEPKLGTRQTLEPGLQSGQIDILPEYAASALEYINKGAGEASGDVTATVAKLTARMQPLNITVTKASGALDTNAFAVTKSTAGKYHLVTMSDLTKSG